MELLSSMARAKNIQATSYLGVSEIRGYLLEVLIIRES